MLSKKEKAQEKLANFDKLTCPLCHGQLLLRDFNLQCPTKHNFDITRKGYVNLLLNHSNNIYNR